LEMAGPVGCGVEKRGRNWNYAVWGVLRGKRKERGPPTPFLNRRLYFPENGTKLGFKSLEDQQINRCKEGVQKRKEEK